MHSKQPLELNNDFKYALDLAEKEGQNMFITGKAGTGKSTLLQLFRNTSKKNVIVLAPTGIAALNVKGQTIHSFFKFPAKPISRGELKKLRSRKVYQKVEVIIIDEISMVRADLLDNIDYFLRINRETPLPFGGVQVIFFGDLFQLPPIVSTEAEQQLFSGFYESPYFFSAKVFEDNFELKMLELRKVYRQDNRFFLRLLDTVRLNRTDFDDLEDLNERYLPNFKTEEFFITLSARNYTVNNINRQRIDAIPLPAQIYTAKINGDFPAHRYPTEAILSLKLDAQVMFIKNDPEKQFVNGTIGKIVKLEDKSITVMVEDDNHKTRYIEVSQMEWEVLKYNINPENPEKIDTETLGTFTQYPLKLAWAITIHKSQGKTFDKVIIDLGKGAFEYGQTYVALSRCRTLEGIVLKQAIRASDIKTDERIVEFYERYF